MNGADLLLIIIGLVLLGFVAWVARTVGSDQAERKLDAYMADERLRARRTALELQAARQRIEKLQDDLWALRLVRDQLARRCAEQGSGDVVR